MSVVFISYAKQDLAIAEKLYNELKLPGVDAWLDTKKLLPGQQWKSEINKAIRNCSCFIALISKHSISKRGYVQSELRTALDVLDQCPPDEIFVIPVRIDESTPPHERILELHWVNLYLSWDKGIEKIIQSIESNINSKGEQIRISDLSNIDYTTLESLLEQERWEQADKETIRIMCCTIGKNPNDIDLNSQTEQGVLSFKEIECFPCVELNKIDHLWTTHSRGKFGFSIQKEIYDSANQNLEMFSKNIGWRRFDRWMPFILIWEYDLLKGTLPIGYRGGLIHFQQEQYRLTNRGINVSQEIVKSGITFTLKGKFSKMAQGELGKSGFSLLWLDARKKLFQRLDECSR